MLEFESSAAPEVEPLMGWTGSSDTRRQVRLSFPTKEQALTFAKRQGWDYTVGEPHEPRLRPKSYADNFRRQPQPRVLPAKARHGSG